MTDIETVEVETVTPKSTRAKARHHTFVIDKPPTSGGTDRGPMASEYFLASLASCHITTAHKIAEKRQGTIDKIRINGTLHLDGDLITNIVLNIQVKSKIPLDELETIFRLTERICTISRATSAPIEKRLQTMDGS
jgi:uncharacterized OsmC-like protein